MRSLKNSKLVDIQIIVLVTILLTLLIWLPYLLKIHNFYNLDFSAGFSTIYRNFDGIEYIVIAKSLYNPHLISNLPFTLSPSYYAAHFPGFSLLILLFAPFLGYLKSMLFVSVLFTILSAISFYLLVKDFNLSKSPLFLTVVFLILPARWVIVHSVGSAETVFLFFIIQALYFFLKFEKTSQQRFIYLTALFGLLAQLTRPPGILFFIGLGLYILWKIYQKQLPFFQAVVRYLPLIVIPLSLLGIFYWYGQTYHDFFAYFHSGDNIHLTFPPFQVFNKNQTWVGDIWLEDIVYVFILSFLGLVYLFKQKLYPLAFFVLVYLLATCFVVHRDISRYALPIFPLIIIAFEKVLVSKEMKIVLVIVALAIYLYAQNFILANTAPIPNLQYFN